MAVSYDHSATLTELTDDVRGFGEHKDNRLSAALVANAINSGIVKAYQIITRFEPQRAIGTTTIAVVSGTATYAFAASDGVGTVHLVAIKDSDAPSGYRELDSVALDDRYQIDSSSVTRDTVRYHLFGGGVTLYPTPTWSEDPGLLIGYRKHPPKLVSGTDSWDGLGVAGWREYVVAHALFMAAAKSDDQIAAWKTMRDEATEGLIRNARLDAAQPRRVNRNSSRRRRAWSY